MSQAESQLILVSPFVKLGALTRILRNIKPTVSVSLTTRWRIDEFIAGISDLEAFTLMQSLPNAQLFLVQNLHAKLYLNESVGLIGSANITHAGLNGPDSGNLEILHDVNRTDTGVDEVVKKIDQSKTLATHKMYLEMLAVLRCSLDPPPLEQAESGRSWFPLTRDPSMLWLTLHSGVVDSVRSDELKRAELDATALGVPYTQDRAIFEKRVALALTLNDSVTALRQFLRKDRYFGELREWVGTRARADRNPTMATQCLIRWLIYFLPDTYTYRRPGHSEIIGVR
ncbi:phospholipase D family protein [Rhodococcus sp. MEB041]|uniref:phospholipase D family protein n=1 Tax=Rhodococcus sp. MEB041 TaxID=3040323 RepID=UPI00254C617B|nr:phospholipase D family protein [Rhodococcus sp. MEB041]